MIKYDEIESAFMFVSADYYGENSAYLNQETGEIVYRSTEMSMDDSEDEDLDADIWLPIPHKDDLDLGEELVFDFVDEYLPDDHDHVRRIFSKRGAYGRFKDFLDRRDLLEDWYDYSNKREEEALREWCEENEVELDD